MNNLFSPKGARVYYGLRQWYGKKNQKGSYDCAMPGCESFASTFQTFRLHMWNKHGVKISVEELQAVHGKTDSDRPRD